ncbi:MULTISPECIES: C4-dicarboxylate TRAP transporter substrate-binding protein [Ramlibacter]|uniref:DctP family TRAP transporter solute-binding subunit n=1 Tax=Ramlibacter pinisoli TaxID=2682844 RepID=A0A6N8IWN5_9BURK|nr:MULTISPECIES: C4-dicarboxylate TRAP transporter substrate-binding protein [Ramlibacter]MBA2961020.1 TRAP transporter substrate-binding protein DctP [Ramlibacter sp. CGMCC 1.13660]MVQ30965.1 DctP family TRAP transporter solute-binding subunit [Ramlibacter pinisoli]
MNVRRHFLAAAALAGLLGAVAPAQAESYQLRFSTSQVNPNEPVVKVMHSFADRVKERSKGQLTLTIFTGDQLGPQKKVNEMIKGGARVLSVTDYGQLSQFVPDMAVVAGPYMFANPDEAKRLFTSPVFGEMSTRLEQQGLKLVMADGLFGVRHLLASKPVRTPADIAGMTLRVPPSPIMLETFTALGARPQALPWGEVYNALQTGVVDAAEANYGSLAGSKLYEVRKVVSNTAHQMMFAAFVTSTSFFNSLPADLQKILLEEGRKAGAELTAATVASDKAFAEELKKNGVQIVENVDVKAFAEKAKAAYAKVPGLTPGIYDKARQALAH